MNTRFFIHKFTDGTMVKFTKTPQVKHKPTGSLCDVKIDSYIRMITGRIAQVKSIYQKNVDTRKEASDSQRIESIYIFVCHFLDNDQVLDMQPSITMQVVKINWLNLLLYKRFMKKNNTTNNNE
jgi:hypothetical protein